MTGRAEPTRGRTGRRARRRLGVTAAVLVALLAVWLGWCHAVVQTPRLDAPAPVDAVLVLGGIPSEERTARALDLAAAGLTRTVLISVPSSTPDSLTARTCADPPAGLTVHCFPPEPATTRGEAEELAREAQRYGWTRVAVVTSTYHVSRSRLIVDRCFDGTVLMVASADHVSVGQWAFQYLYQTAAWVKAEILRGC